MSQPAKKRATYEDLCGIEVRAEPIQEIELDPANLWVE
jgi:hypothetical protein